MKDSGVEWIGEIPEDWEVISNKYIFDTIKGKNPREINNDKIGLPYIGASDLEKNSEYHEYKNYCNEDLPLASKEDTLILWDGARAGLIGVNHEGYISSTIVKVIPRVDYVNKKFWYWYLKGFQPIMNDWVGGTTIPHMNRRFINDIYFLKFPVKKQHQIANYLDQKVSQIDHILEETRKSIEEYKKYKQLIITEAVTKGLDPDVKMKDSRIEWIGEIPEEWKTSRIKYSVVLRNEKGTFNKEVDTYIGLENIESFSGKHIKTDSVYSDGIYDSFKSGDILFNRLRPYLTKCLMPSFDGFCTGELLIIREFNGYKKYLFYYLISPMFINVLTSSTYGTKMPRASWDFIKELFITLPNRQEQQQIADYLDNKCSEIDSLISQKETLLNDLESYKKSLIYECVTGKKKVI